MRRGRGTMRSMAEGAILSAGRGPAPSTAFGGPPCNSRGADSGMMLGAVAGGRPCTPRASSPQWELGAPPVVPSTSNSRLGRKSPVAQGRGSMDMKAVGIDVSKDRLDVHVWPDGIAFAVARDGKGLAELIERLLPLTPDLVIVEATGGFETVVTAALAGAGLPLVVANPAQIRHFAQAAGTRAKTDPIDAAMIARFGHDMKPDVRPLAGRGDAAPRRPRRPPAPDHRDDRRRAEPRAPRHSAADQEEHRPPRPRPREGARRDRVRDRRRPARLAPLARQGGPPRLRPRRRAGRRPNPHRRAARARHPRQEEDRQPRRPCALHPPVRPVEGQEHDRRRPQERALRPVPRSPRRQPSQPRPQGLPRSPPRRRQAQDGRPHRRRPQAPHHPQRHPARPKTMAARLTPKTVAPLSARRSDNGRTGSSRKIVPARQRRNGFASRSSPMLLIGPWPQRKATSSGSGMSFILIDAMRAA